MADELQSILGRCRAIVRGLRRTPEYKRAAAAAERDDEAGVDGEALLLWTFTEDLVCDVLGEHEFPQTIAFLRAASRHTAESVKAEAEADRSGAANSAEPQPVVGGAQ
jgi:hypothetical protein